LTPGGSDQTGRLDRIAPRVGVLIRTCPAVPFGAAKRADRSTTLHTGDRAGDDRRVDLDRDTRNGEPTAQAERPVPPPVTTPQSALAVAGLTTAGLLDVQRTAGNAAARTMVQREAAGDVFAGATSGARSALPHLARMERAFGQSFADVHAHVGTPEAQRGLARLGAGAAALGRSVAFAERDPGEHVVAHELAHVVQQRRGSQAVQAKRTSRPGDAAERAADRAADAVVRGEPVSDVGVAEAGTIHRTTVNTNGGVFDNGPMYAPVSGTGAVGERVGANIMVDFTAGDLAEAPTDGIALIQTVTGVTDRAPGAAALNPTRDQQSRAYDNPDDNARFTAGGVAIDTPAHPGGRDAPSHNPVYGVGFGAEAPSTTLNDGTPTVGRTRRGSHVRDPVTGLFAPPVAARMEDGPGRVLRVAGQSFEMTFELAALVTAGPMQDTYLGSVEWGWQSDATGAVTLKPFRALASGAPTATFMQAASAWNAATMHDTSFWAWMSGEDEVATVDLPVTTLASGVQAAVDMRTADIIQRIPVVRAELGGLPAGPSVDRTNKDFELRALVTELRKRKLTVDLSCGSISDTGGAARPPEDEVWLTLSGGGALGTTLTGTRIYRAGDAHTYEFPVTDFMPLDGPIHIDVNEHDRAGTSSRAHDDVLIALDWAPPYAVTATGDRDGHYTAVVGFDK
jgi:hypothetical protein